MIVLQHALDAVGMRDRINLQIHHSKMHDVAILAKCFFEEWKWIANQAESTERSTRTRRDASTARRNAQFGLCSSFIEVGWAKGRGLS